MSNKIPEMHQLSLLMIIKKVTQTLHDTHYESFVRNSSYVCLVQVLWKPPCCCKPLKPLIFQRRLRRHSWLCLVNIHALITALLVHLLWCGCDLKHLVMHVVALWNVCVCWQQLQQASPCCVLWLVHYMINYLWETKRQIKDIFSSQEINIPSISDSLTLC